jgi:hypothetical protein
MKSFKEIMEALSKDAKASEWIDDFVNSDNPKFEGKSKGKRKEMALAAYYAKQRNEEVELDEASRVETGELFKSLVNKASAASDAGNHTQAKKHLANAQTARYGILSKHMAKHTASFDKYKELKHSYTNYDEPIREQAPVAAYYAKQRNEEVELDEATKVARGDSINFNKDNKNMTAVVLAVSGNKATVKHPVHGKFDLDLSKTKHEVIMDEEVELDELFGLGKKKSNDDSFVSDKHYNELSSHIEKKHPGYRAHSIKKTAKGIEYQAYHKDDKDFVHGKKGIYTPTTKEEVELDESKEHIENHLADKDINAKVEGKTVKVHSSDVAAAKKHMGMMGYKDHKVVGGLNEATHVPVAPGLVKHRIGVTVSEPDHPMVSKRKEKIQKFVIVTHSDNKEGARAVGEKFYKKKGYRVHDSWHAGINEEVELDEAKNVAKGDWHVYDTKTKEIHSTHSTHTKAKNKMVKLNDTHDGYETPGNLIRSKFGIKAAAYNEEVELDESRGHKILARAMNRMATRKAVASGEVKVGAKRDDEAPFDNATPAGDKKDEFGNDVKNRAQYLAKKGLKSVKESNMLTYSEFVEKLEEGKMDDFKDRMAAEREKRLNAYDYSKEKAQKPSNVTKHYAKASDNEDDDEDDKKPSTQPEVKRGRGRPKGSVGTYNRR